MKSTSVLAFLAVSVAPAFASSSEDFFFSSLLRRQAPGTPAYECHETCGTAIGLSRGPDPCHNNIFLSDYAACLACAGPEDQNIWPYYGATLTAVGTKCGLSATPGKDGGSVKTSSSTLKESTEASTALPGNATPTETDSEAELSTTVTTPSESESTTIVVTSGTIGTVTANPTSSVSGGLNPTSSLPPLTGGANARRSGSFVTAAVFAVAVLGM